MSKDINLNIDLKALPAQLGRLGEKIGRYVPLIFFVLLAMVYGFLLLSINSLSSAQPDSSEVNTEITELTPHIDKTAVKQLQGLENNSVNVQTLFSSGRGNPFGE